MGRLQLQDPHPLGGAVVRPSARRDSAKAVVLDGQLLVQECDLSRNPVQVGLETSRAPSACRRRTPGSRQGGESQRYGVQNAGSGPLRPPPREGERIRGCHSVLQKLRSSPFTAADCNSPCPRVLSQMQSSRNDPRNSLDQYTLPVRDVADGKLPERPRNSLDQYRGACASRVPATASQQSAVRVSTLLAGVAIAETSTGRTRRASGRGSWRDRRRPCCPARRTGSRRRGRSDRCCSPRAPERRRYLNCPSGR